MPNPANRDPAEGSREIIDHELGRASAKKPEQQAQKPGGTPTPSVKGSSPSHPREPEGQQGSTQHEGH
jgi:hypothetical protein